MNNNNTTIDVIDWDTAYNTDTLDVTQDNTPTATVTEGNPEIDLSDTTWQTSELFMPSDVVSDADIIAYARARHWSVFAITEVEFIDVDEYYDYNEDGDSVGWTIIGK